MKRLIAFEGGEGCGKGAAIDIAKEIFTGKGYNVLVLGAIKDGPIASIARERFLKQNMDLPTAAITKAAGHLDIIHRIRLYLNESPANLVLLDRSFYSYAVYDKRYFSNKTAKFILEDSGLFSEFPDNLVEKAILVRTPIPTCLKRLQERADIKSFMDLKPSEEHIRLYEYYELEFQAGRYSEEEHYIDNSGSLSDLATNLNNLFDTYPKATLL